MWWAAEEEKLTGCKGDCSISDSLGVGVRSRFVPGSSPLDSEGDRIATTQAQGGDPFGFSVALHGVE